MSGTYSQKLQIGRRVVAAEEWALCTVKSCSRGVGDRVLHAQSRCHPHQKPQLVADWGRAVENPGHRGNAKYTGDFLAQKNLKNRIADSVYLTQEIQE